MIRLYRSSPVANKSCCRRRGRYQERIEKVRQGCTIHEEVLGGTETRVGLEEDHWVWGKEVVGQRPGAVEFDVLSASNTSMDVPR